MLLALVVNLALAVAPASAPLEALPQKQHDEARARAAWDKGVAAYEDGQLPEAIGYFEETYRYSGRSGPLFSLGQAHRHRWEDQRDPRQRHLALTRFQQYLDAEPDGARAVEAQRYTAELMPLSQLELEGPGDLASVTRVSISTAVKGARARIDGGEPFELPAAPDVEPGRHRISVEAEGFHAWERNLEVPEGSTVAVQVPLREVDARLNVNAPAGADVYVDGQRVVRLPAKEAVAVSPGVHQIGVARPGRNLFVREMDFGRGQTRKLDADLEVTGQRKVAYAAIGVGVGATVAAVPLLAVAIVRQRQAQAIDKRLSSDSVSQDGFRERQRRAEQRDTMRVASIAAGATGLALIATGIILYVTDKPAVASRLQRPERRRVSASAAIGPTSASAVVKGRF